MVEWNGRMDWNGGMDWWTGIIEQKGKINHYEYGPWRKLVPHKMYMR